MGPGGGEGQRAELWPQEQSPSPSVGIRPEGLAPAPAQRRRERAGSPGHRTGRATLRLGQKGPASTPASGDSASAPVSRGWSIPKLTPAPLPGGESAGAAGLPSLAPTCGPSANLGSSSSLGPSRSGSTGASGGPAPAPASRLGGGGGSGAWGFCCPAARIRSRRPAPPLGLLRLRVMLLLAPLPRSTRAAAAAAAAHLLPPPPQPLSPLFPLLSSPSVDYQVSARLLNVPPRPPPCTPRLPPLVPRCRDGFPEVSI